MNADMTVPPAVILGRLPDLANSTDQVMLLGEQFSAAAMAQDCWEASLRRSAVGRTAGVFLSRNMTSDPTRNAGISGGCMISHANAAPISTLGDLAEITAGNWASFGQLVEQAKAIASAPPESAHDRFARALKNWKGLLAPNHFDAMVLHLDRLLGDQVELDDEGIVPSLGSIEDLLSFLSSRPWARPPAVGLTRTGQFAVSWSRPTPTRDLSITFLGNGSVKWYAYGLGRRGKSSAAGSSERLDLPTLLARLGCDGWLAE